MGKYDNYSAKYEIEAQEKKLEKLLKKRKPDQFQIDQQRQYVEHLKLFETCQIFGKTNPFLMSMYDPNTLIKFSDDNKAMMMEHHFIPYVDIESYEIIEKKKLSSYTTTHRRGAVGRTIVGDMIGGEIGATIGAASAKTVSHTDYFETNDGYLFILNLKDGRKYQMDIPNNKISKSWLQLTQKIDAIINGDI